MGQKTDARDIAISCVAIVAISPVAGALLLRPTMELGIAAGTTVGPAAEAVVAFVVSALLAFGFCVCASLVCCGTGDDTRFGWLGPLLSMGGLLVLFIIVAALNGLRPGLAAGMAGILAAVVSTAMIALFRADWLRRIPRQKTIVGVLFVYVAVFVTFSVVIQLRRAGVIP